MELLLAGKIIIVTDGGQQMAGAICAALAKEKAIPVLIGPHAEMQKATVEKIKHEGAEAFGVHALLNDARSCGQALEFIFKKWGSINGLVNNGKAFAAASLAGTSVDDYTATLQGRLLEYFLVTKYALPALRLTKGAIVNISHDDAQPNAIASGGSNALTREWAVDLVKEGIRVNAVLADVSQAHDAASHHLKTLADLVMFLLSSRSSHTTGQLIPAGVK